jgi:hypothetical protein
LQFTATSFPPVDSDQDFCLGNAGTNAGDKGMWPLQWPTRRYDFEEDDLVSATSIKSCFRGPDQTESLIVKSEEDLAEAAADLQDASATLLRQ